MKIIKPLRLGILHRPWRWQGRNHLGVSILALADMGGQPRLRPEPELWQLAANELADCGGLVDLAIPKACAEFLATGYAYTHHQAQKDACLVKIAVGKREKSLVAFGDRFWVNGKASHALPFERLRLDWQHAFGGAGDRLNPGGKGAAPITQDGVRCHPLANIERPDQGQTPLQASIAPAGFGPLDFVSPANFSRIGKQYDQRWMEQDYPGFARDIDWRIFNRADSDQWWQDSPALPPGAPWGIWNMHPEKPVQRGCLPPWQARCFIQRSGATTLNELTLRATTVWFFPHLEQMLLIWQGNCQVKEDDAVDIEQLMAAIETTQAPRSHAFYQDIARLRGHKETGAAYALREQDLVTENIIGPWLDTAPQTMTSPLSDHLAARGACLRAQQHPNEGPSGRAQDKTMPTPPLPALDDLPAFMTQINRQAAELQQRAQEKASAITAVADVPDVGPQNYRRLSELLRVHHAASPQAEQENTTAQRALHEIYRLSADTRPPAAQQHAGSAVRQRVLTIMHAGGDFSDIDLTGADLSGLDLRQGNFQRAMLESARLDNCLLDGANLDQAMLAHASLLNASLCGAQLNDTCLTGARCVNVRFADARMRGVLLQQTTLEKCSFERAQIDNLLFHSNTLSQCRFHQARLENCLFLQPDLSGLDFRHSQLEKCTFLQGRLRDSRFCAAHLVDCAFITMDLDGLRCEGSRLDSCAFSGGTHALNASFRAASLNSCNFRQTPLTSANFAQARCQCCDFSACNLQHATMTQITADGCLFIRADLSGASVDNARLIGALLQKCQLAGTNLRETNLFRADLSQSIIDAKTCLQGAYTQQCKTLPRAEEPKT
ncbi:DUF2169 domain-containing protein [Acerihabitans sp. TG2]|uniref:DUF2169 family type VI secretion system accessory protein n=1 Tax=Acerihabitans sp. TG2 TaxID=3096008 RepID=UPI002B22E4D4|nr:DUF2169 domain-containing protein [Acerihabitans sp. TG2]MEA9390969.1 DUF2169 domain-containing protein [Acerihabitans sp. TG2]